MSTWVGPGGPGGQYVHMGGSRRFLAGFLPRTVTKNVNMLTTHGWVQVECTGGHYWKQGGVAEQAIRGEFAAHISPVYTYPAVQTDKHKYKYKQTQIKIQTNSGGQGDAVQAVPNLLQAASRIPHLYNCPLYKQTNLLQIL